jgi:hypothetical protein
VSSYPDAMRHKGKAPMGTSGLSPSAGRVLTSPSSPPHQAARGNFTADAHRTHRPFGSGSQFHRGDTWADWWKVVQCRKKWLHL